MPELATLGLFTLAALALLLTPGPAVLYIVTTSLHQGVRAGFIAILGLGCGGLVHVAAAAFGLSALLAASAAAYTWIQVLGGRYLIYLGARTLMSRGGSAAAPDPGRSRRTFRDAVIVNAFNPKAALFFLAFLPQFVHPEAGPVRTQFLVLGLGFILLGMLTDSLYVLAAGRLGAWFRARRGAARATRWVAGGVYVGLGLAALLGGRRGT